jgi:hypothetical protein
MGDGGFSRFFFAAAWASIVSGCDMAAAPRRAPIQAQFPEARYEIDTARKRVWFLTGEGAFVCDATKPQRRAFVLPAWSWAGAPHGCLPDLALGPKGEALITSDTLPTLWRIDPDSFAVTAHALALDADADKDVGFSALVYSAREGVFYAASYHHGSLWRIDPGLQRAQKIALSAPLPPTCGLAMQPRGMQLLAQPADVCVATAEGGWSVMFAADRRSAYVSAAPCFFQSNH